MAHQEMLPAIYFLFSRRDCEDYAQRFSMMRPNLVRDEETPIPTLRVDPELQRQQIESLRAVKAGRSAAGVQQALEAVRAAARGSDNLMPPIIAAAHALATEQEICDVLREVFGTYTDPAEF